MDSNVVEKKGGLQQLLLRIASPAAIISIAQLFGTSLWFSANSTAADLARVWSATPADIGWLTNAVQLGFILGTLLISMSGVADKIQASKIFVLSAIAGAVFNVCFAWLATGIVSGAAFRFCVGVCLAGIYPMGMKLIVSWAPNRTGQALAQLVAMLTLGTALPHALKLLGSGFQWQLIITASSVLAIFGACLIGCLGDGPHTRRISTADSQAPDEPTTALGIFRIRPFRAASIGYFGHMWELYTFWTAVPLLISRTHIAEHFPALGVAGLSFVVIGVGAVGSLIGGYLSRVIGSAKVALGALTISGLSALVFSVAWRGLPPCAVGALLLVWGAAVVADSPQFSALAAKACPASNVGSALAIMNSIGFAVTVVSIALTTALLSYAGLDATWALVPGPLIGLLGYGHTLRGSSQKEQCRTCR
ncbi:MFS transporter [Paraburkholderia sp. JHI869]|uniref:MFS transporter n=1 Tax=Paraburkholderia sp. JHI869 TaxID=3112959 RepID=UPI0031767B74